MTDYECPTCGGGFPAADADDGCPWCGEAMDGGDGATAPRLTTGDRLGRDDLAGSFTDAPAIGESIIPDPFHGTLQGQEARGQRARGVNHDAE